MTDAELFTLVGTRELPPREAPKRHRAEGFPWVSLAVLAVIVLGCLACDLLMTHDPTYLDLAHCSEAPNGTFFFGTDALGRDLFSGIWYGGRISLTIGVLATLLSTAVATVYGTVSGLAPQWLDTLLMRLTELFLSVPNLLLIVFLQAILDQANAVSISVTIGLTSWAGIAKIVRTEVRQLRHSEYVLAARAMGGGFFHVLVRHLFPNFFSAILFMVVMNLRGAIVAESTLSFLGLGLPLEVISWGSMLSLAEKALLSGAWWVILLPGGFLIAVLLCVTNLGNYLRRQASRKESNL
jgi:peptide/nickel transport system permease protein